MGNSFIVFHPFHRWYFHRLLRSAIGAAMLRVRALICADRAATQTPARGDLPALAPNVDKKPDTLTWSTRYCTQICQLRRWRSTKAHFTSGLSQNTSWLSQDVALHLEPRQLSWQTADPHLLHVTQVLPLTSFNLPARPNSITSVRQPQDCAASAVLSPGSTSRTALSLNSSVYRPRFPFRFQWPFCF